MPTVTVGGDGGVYVSRNDVPAIVVCTEPPGAHTLHIGRLNAALDAFTGPLYALSALQYDPNSVPIPGTAIPPGDDHYTFGIGTSLVAAQDIRCPPSCPDCGVVYYAYAAAESQAPACDAKDVFFSRGIYCKTNDTWTWSAPVSVPGVSEDNKDQLLPSVTVTNDAVGDTEESTIFVSWYDRTTNCATVAPPDNVNRCIKVISRSSIDGGLTWGTAHSYVTPDIALTDPELLPFRCQDPENSRFIGDYHAGLSHALHSHGVFSVAPEGGAPRTAELWQNIQFYEADR